MEIKTVADLDEALERGPHAWPGGYPIYFITADGGALAFQTVKDEIDTIREAIDDDDTNGGWRVNYADINWEDDELYDDHTGDLIESAYGGDDDDED